MDWGRKAMNLKQLKFPIFDSVILRLSQSKKFSRGVFRVGILLSAMILAIPGMAVNAQDSDGLETYDISIGTTISQGFMYRLEGRDNLLVDSDPNGDDGNLNFDKGLVSAATKVTSEIDISLDDFGFFTRFTGYWDLETADGELKRTRLSNEAKKMVGRGVKLLDFYGYKDFEYGDTFGDVRVGNVVLNWGESTFVQNGINVVNPVDVSRLRTPGSELREALVPVPLVAVSIAPTDNLSVESFVQLRWEKTEIDPTGTYFSTNDYIGEGGKYAEIDLRGAGIPLPPNDQDDWLRVKRGPDKDARNSGQFGIALRYLSEQFNGTEFGLFFTRYHSRRPIASANTGNAHSLQLGLAGAGYVGTKAATPGVVPQIMGAIGALTDPRQIYGAINAQIRGSFIDNQHDPTMRLSETEITQLTQQLTGIAANVPPAGRVAALPNQLPGVFEGFAAQTGIDRYAQNAHYFVEYPENIDMIGVSFNTLLGNTGWALQGEISYHDDAPLQREDASIFAEGLEPINHALVLGNPGHNSHAHLLGLYKLRTQTPTLTGLSVPPVSR